MPYILLYLTQIVLSREIKVFLQLTCIGLFGRKSALLHLETFDLQEVFLSKLNHFSQ
jgi:hypothetical protein